LDDSNDGARNKASSRRLIGVAAGLVVLAAAVAALVAHRDENDSSSLVLYGNIEVRQVDLAFNEGDRILAMHVEEGDAVVAGQLLAELDDSLLEHIVLEAEARVAARRALAERFEHGSRPEEIARARAAVAAAEAELADARITHERQEKLVEARAISQQIADDTHAAHLAAQAALEIARENLHLAVEGPRSEDIAVARARLRADENALELAKHRLANTKLYAPAGGTVLIRILEPGAVVLPNSPVYTLALADPVWARAYLSESDLGRVYPGMKAEIVSDSFPDRPHAGWVGFISPTAEFTPKPVETPDLRTSLVYRTRIFVRDPDRTLRQGMPVTIRLPFDPSPDRTLDRPGVVAGERLDSAPASSEAGSPPQPPGSRVVQ